MFENVVIPLSNQNDLDQYDHTISSVMKGHYLYVFWFAILLFFVLLTLEIVEWCLIFFRVKLNDKVQVEGLLEYPSCLKTIDLENHIKEEEII